MLLVLWVFTSKQQIEAETSNNRFMAIMWVELYTVAPLAKNWGILFEQSVTGHMPLQSNLVLTNWDKLNILISEFGPGHEPL